MSNERANAKKSALEIIREKYDLPQYSKFKEIKFHVSFRQNEFNKEYLDMLIEDTIAVFHDGELCFIGCGPYIKYYHITKSTIIRDKVLIYNTLLKSFKLRDPMDYEIIDYNEAKSTDLAEDEGLTKLLQK